MLHVDIHDPGVVREPNRIQCNRRILVSNQWRLALPRRRMENLKGFSAMGAELQRAIDKQIWKVKRCFFEVVTVRAA